MLGNPPQGQDHAPLGCNDGPDKSRPNPCDKVVRSRTFDGMESHFSPNPSKPKDYVSTPIGPNLARMEKSLVGLSHEHSNPSRGESFCLERIAINFIGANLERIESDQGVELIERRMLEGPQVALNMWGNRSYYTLLQVFYLTVKFSLLLGQRERELGVMKHLISISQGEGFTNTFLRRVGWNLIEQRLALLYKEECPTPLPIFLNEYHHLEFSRCFRCQLQEISSGPYSNSSVIHHDHY